MSSPVSIASNALLLLGAQPINSFDEPTDRARLAANLYPEQRAALLRAHPWNCTIKRAALAPEEAPPAHGWARQFVLPDDCLRVLSVGEDDDTPESYALEGRRRILYNGTVLRLRYVADVPEAEWDAGLVHVMTLRMASALAYAITKSGSMAQLAQDNYLRALKEAKAVDGQENPPEAFTDSPLLAARMGARW